MQGFPPSKRTVHICLGAAVLCAVAVEAAFWMAKPADDCVGVACRLGAQTTDSDERLASAPLGVPQSGALLSPDPVVAETAPAVSEPEPLGPPDPLEVETDDPAALELDEPGDLDGVPPNEDEINLAELLAEDDELSGSTPESSSDSSASDDTATPDSNNSTDAQDETAPDGNSFGFGSTASAGLRTVTVVSPVESVESSLWAWPGSADYSAMVANYSCDAHDAVRISKASQLYLLSDPGYRVFCLSPGAYTALSQITLNNVSGTPTQPRVVRLDSDILDSALAFTAAADADLASLPPVLLEDSDHWVFSGVRWATDSTALTVRDSDGIVIDRARFELSGAGIEITGLSGFQLQRSLLESDELAGENCLEAELDDGATVAVTNSEFLGCHRAVSIASVDSATPDAVRIAGNEFHRTAGRGDGCDVVGLWIDSESADSSDGFESVSVIDNQFSGWKATSDCAAESASAVRLSDRVSGAGLERNVIWSGAVGITLDSQSQGVRIDDNVVVGSGSEQGVRIGAGNAPAGAAPSGAAPVTLGGNHFVRLDRWINSERSAMHLSCNLVADSGLAVTPVDGDTELSSNTYLSAQPGVLASTASPDQIGTSSDSNLGPLCLATRVLSDPDEICLERAARDPVTVQCGSDFWVVE